VNRKRWFSTLSAVSSWSLSMTPWFASSLASSTSASPSSVCFCPSYYNDAPLLELQRKGALCPKGWRRERRTARWKTGEDGVIYRFGLDAGYWTQRKQVERRRSLSVLISKVKVPLNTSWKNELARIPYSYLNLFGNFPKPLWLYTCTYKNDTNTKMTPFYNIY